MKTKILKIDKYQIDDPCVEEAGEVLKAGGLVAFPTETVYGLGADALNEEAARKTYEAKGRPSDNPLIVHIADYEALDFITADRPEQTKELADQFWPGPLTMIFQKSEQVPPGTTGGLETVAVRMPDHPAALALIRAGGGYVSGPSANTSGRPSPTSAGHVEEDLGGKIDIILDAGPVEIGVESTIVDMTVTPPMILRPGAITAEMLSEVLGEVTVDKAILDENSQEAPKAPGMKYRHYAPKAQLMIVEGEPEESVKAIKQIAYEQTRLGYRVGIIASSEYAGRYTTGLVKAIGSRENENTVAKNLYRVLREFDDDGVDYIYSESFTSGGIGEAVMNRLMKAAGRHVIDAAEIMKLQQYRRILFVSKGDTCRGPMAAELLKKQPLIQEYQIASRGMVVLFPEPANPIAQEIMKSHQMSIADHEAAALTEADLDSDTLVLVMEETQKWKIVSDYENVKNVYTLNEFIGVGNEIHATYGKPLQDYAKTYETVKRFMELLADKLNKEATGK